jgi:tetratricopeptide (TPR) repeat protein
MLRQIAVIASFSLVMTSQAGAVGMEDDTPPAPTPTTLVCEEGMVWDADTAACVAIVESRLPAAPDRLIATVRELAYAGRHPDALTLLRRAPDQGDSMVLTYFGYVTRKMGDMAGGLAYYDRALAVAPDNHLTRAYLGLALMQMGQSDQAEMQLAEIRTRGGAGGWAASVLETALRTGDASRYDY